MNQIRIVVGKVATEVDPADIADVVTLLCSDAADVTSGAAVPVDGEAKRTGDAPWRRSGGRRGLTNR